MSRPSVAIACATGGFKGVFLHGVLAAFEAAGFRADAYAAASSSVIPAAWAAIGRVEELGLAFWLTGRRILGTLGNGMSQMMLAGIEQAGPTIIAELFRQGQPRFLVAANAVDEAGAAETQSRAARRLGRWLLLEAARGNKSWVEQHLSLVLFDTAAAEPDRRLTAANFPEVAYASSRMLHAWDIPAWVDGRPFIDAFYTCNCPAMELAERGYELVVALATEPILYRDIFQQEVIPRAWWGAAINIIAPDWDPAQKGVQYTTASTAGLQDLYHLGLAKGRQFLRRQLTGVRRSPKTGK